MKKIPNLFYCLLLFLFVSFQKASAVTTIDIPNPISSTDFSELVGKVLEWVLGVAGSIALFMLIAGGIMYITSTGDEQKIATAKKIINWTILGLIVILASYSIIVVLESWLT
ncbi:MAG: hypothetical protein KAI67_04155 [Candidatus Pacebacteria bacterium]|nr:hypothetical protein [Candidatus Paceibacterota bacterium]